MSKEIVNVAGGLAADALQNTHCTMTLNGWSAAAAIMVSVVVLGGAAVAAIAICEGAKRNESLVIEHQETR